MVRRSSRLSPSSGAKQNSPVRKKRTKDIRPAAAAAAKEDPDVSSDDEEEEQGFFLDGVRYPTYQEMVNAKIRRNQQVLRDSGLLETVAEIKAQSRPQKKPAAAGLKKRKATAENVIVQRRKSNRLQGVPSDGLYVDDERSGKFTIRTASTGARVQQDADGTLQEEEPPEEHYRGRINDGSALSLEEAVELTGEKWTGETSVAEAQDFCRNTLSPLITSKSKKGSPRGKSKSPKSVIDTMLSSEAFLSQVADLSVDDVEHCKAKVVPDRIYAVAAHPSTEQLIVSAGDKRGYVGLWNVDSRAKEESNNGVHLFRFHSGSASCLEWNAEGSALFSASYDGTVRWFDVASETFEEVFATYDSQKDFKDKLGYGLDTGYRYWTQYGCLDPRNQQCFFLSTSVGTAMHVDLRSRGRITFHDQLSEKKINTLSLHPDGHSLLSGGLDCHVKVWDLRKFGDSRSVKSHKAPKPVAWYNCGKSVNSAFFSPSGDKIVTTTMANRLDLFENMHLSSKIVKPLRSIRHDNMTGRWLSTFMAKWHPSLDIFCVGSMAKPRQVEIFNSSGECLRGIRGEALTAVASRCCFHSSAGQLTVLGGNSSGHVTVIR